MSTIDLMIDEENELTFQVQIEGSRPGTAKCRLMLESPDMTFAFEGQSTGDEVSVTLPPLDHVIKEGIYDMTLEVVVDDRYFEPLKLQGAFEKRLKVTAEAVTVKAKPQVTTSASLVEVKKKNKTAKIKVNNRSKEKVIKEEKASLSDKDIMNIIKSLTGKRNK
jgi:hypothetical protein|tara:strand:+ start:6539 stop:7030 length:492 start_codon:yes stop_codon:yes gene_type:complete